MPPAISKSVSSRKCVEGVPELNCFRTWRRTTRTSPRLDTASVAPQFSKYTRNPCLPWMAGGETVGNTRQYIARDASRGVNPHEETQECLNWSLSMQVKEKTRLWIEEYPSDLPVHTPVVSPSPQSLSASRPATHENTRTSLLVERPFSSVSVHNQLHSFSHALWFVDRQIH